MKQHTLSYKNNIKEMGRELDVKITYGDITLDNEVINSVNPRYQGALLKSVMKELEIDSNVAIPKDTEINFKFGISLDNSPIEYLDFGNYIVKDIEKQEDSNSYLIKCYDKLLYSMKSYESLGIPYPCKIREYINALCTKLNLNFKNKADTFVNYDKTIPNELYLDAKGNSLGYKYRDVFDELAQVTASTICLDVNDNVEIRYINETNDTIDEEYLKDVNINFGEKFGEINSVVLSRNGEDNIYRKDDLSIQKNGLCEIKIEDNQIMNFNNRDEYIDNIYNKLKGIEYHLNDFSSTGITYYNLLDRYGVKIGNKTYNCIMFNDDIEINQGLVENINTEKPKESQTDYSKADKTDRRINQTYRIVDKQNQTIKELITKTDENSSTIIEVNKSLQGIKAEVSKNTEEIKSVTETSKLVTGTSNLSLDNALASNVLDYKVEGNTEQETTKGYNLAKIANNGYWNINNEGVIDNKNIKGNGQILSQIQLEANTIYNVYFQLLDDTNIQIDYSLVSDNALLSHSHLQRYKLGQIYKKTTLIKENKINNWKLWSGGEATFKFKFWITKGEETENKPYEHYTGGIPSPNPDYPQEVECIKGNIKVKDNGKNLFDKSKVSAGAIKEDGTLYDAGDVFFTTDFIKINPNSFYSKTETGSPRIKLFDKNKKVISTSSFSDILNFKNAGTYTIPFKSAEYIRFTYNINYISSDLLQFEENKEQTSYEPYKETQINIDLQGNELCKIGDTKNSLHIDSSGKTIIEKRNIKLIFTGEENWRALNTSNSGKKRFALKIDNIKTISNPSIKSTLICNYYPTVTSVETYKNYQGIAQEKPYDGGTDINIYDNTYSNNNLSGFKQFLKDKYNSGNPVYMIYELEKPQTIELADTDITLFEGVNNIELLANIDTNTSVNYLLKTPLSKDYATKVETNSAINQKANEIYLGVNEKLSNYSTTTEMNTAIDISAEGINKEVRKKVGEDEIVSKINQSAEEIKIKAEKININGTVSANGNFKVNTDGYMECEKGKFNGGKVLLKGGTEATPNFEIVDEKNTQNRAFITPNTIRINSNGKQFRFDASGVPMFTCGGSKVTLQLMDNLDKMFLTAKEIQCIGTVYANDYKYNSLESLKKNINLCDISALDIIKNIDIYEYNFKNEKDTDKKHIGFVIGDNYKYPIEATSQNNDGVDNYAFTSLCCKAIQEQQEEIDLLKEEIKLLKEKR